MDRALLRRRVAEFVISHGGILPARVAELIRDSGNYALGAGSACLPVDQSGEARLLRRLAAKWCGDVNVVDVGANIGLWARTVRTELGPRASLWCFEPNPASYEVLERGVGAEPGVECHRLALGDRPGVARLFADSVTSPFATLYNDAFGAAERLEAYEVRVETLDRIADAMGINQIDLLKVDVEGHELAVLRGARGLLESRAIRMVQFEFGEAAIVSRTYLRDILDLLSGYETFRLTPRGLRRFTYRPADEVFLLEANYVAAIPPMLGLR